MDNQVMFLQAGEVCARDCEFAADDSSPTGQCLGKEPGREHSFGCDLTALSAVYTKGAEREREKFAEAMKRKKEIRGQAK